MAPQTVSPNLAAPAEADPHRWHFPRQPHTVGETGLNFLFLIELLAKILFLRGQLHLADLAAHTRLSVGVLEPLLAFMRTERLCEVSRSGEAETATTYTLTELGRLRAHEFLQNSQYAGPAPVSLQAYVDQVRKQSVMDMQVTRENLRQVFDGVVVKERILKQFGAAMNSGRAIFVYGPAGTGKTFISERLAGLLSGDVAIPHAVVVDSEVIQVFDPLVHDEIVVEEGGRSLDRRRTPDGRWVLCGRPVVKTGGELSLDMLDLDFDQTAKFYQAPPQVKANNGLLLIDDLGRQLTPALDIMNRWIIPLDRHLDYLALHTGKKFMIPFDVIVVFSTNLPPKQLADEAFLRRLGYKIYIGALDEDEYRAISRQVCEELKIPYSEPGLAHLLNEHHYKENRPLLACIPRDILGQVRDIARYEGMQPELSESLLDWAWNNYFTSD
jgi:DNA-binding PadR family transcriptional regulator